MGVTVGDISDKLASCPTPFPIMKSACLLLCLTWSLFAPLTTVSAAESDTLPAADRPNILFIAVDDMRPELGCYGNPLAHSPNIDRLSAQGVTFDRAYVNIAVCNPSRASMMTGLYPDSVRVWDLRVHFREASPQVVTLPQHLRAHGYHAVGMGKIYHNPTPDPQSWSEPIPVAKFPSPFDEKTRAEILAVQDTLPEGHRHKTNLRGPGAIPNAHNDDLKTGDGVQTANAVAALRRLARSEDEKPFFLAMGYVRPHLPFTPPKKYWDLHDRAALPLAENRFKPENGYPEGVGSSYEMRHYSDLINFPGPDEDEVDEATARRLIHGYYASISQVDALIGRLLTTLEEEGLAENTIVVFWSDHGWKLGEHNAWSKMTNHEIDTRIPLIVYVPDALGNGKRSERLVGSVDLFPTICELAGVPVPEDIDGASFHHLLEDPTAEFKDAVFTQYMQPYEGVRHMGYTIRTTTHRYVEWREVATGYISFRELYDQVADPQENRNVIDAANTALIDRLQRQLHEWNNPRPLDRTPAVRSQPTKAPCELVIGNEHESAIFVYRIDKTGRRIKLKRLEPGKRLTINTFSGNAYVVEAVDGKVHEIVYAAGRKVEIRI